MKKLNDWFKTGDFLQVLIVAIFAGVIPGTLIEVPFIADDQLNVLGAFYCLFSMYVTPLFFIMAYRFAMIAIDLERKENKVCKGCK